MVTKQNLKELSTWVGFFGIVTIIGGVLSAISGLSFFIIGAIPGIIMIFIGVKLRNAKKCADELLALPDAEQSPEKLNLLVVNLNFYFKVQSIMFIVTMALILIGVILTLILGASIMNSLQYQFNY